MLISKSILNGAVLVMLNGTLNGALNGTGHQQRAQHRSREDAEAFFRRDAQARDGRDDVPGGTAASGVGEQQAAARWSWPTFLTHMWPTAASFVVPKWVWPVYPLSHDDGALHPPRNPEWSRLRGVSPVACAVMLAAAGVLCSAGGIGGGGIYVTTLMAAGHLDIVDAVPLSKFIVFLGSLSSLALNLFKASGTKAPLIDYNICRAIVPSSLFGTFAGVFLNGILRETVLELLLTVVLCVMAYMVCRSTVAQYNEETAAAEGKAASMTPLSASTTPRTETDIAGSRMAWRVEDIIISSGLLLVVIGGNVTHHRLEPARSGRPIAYALSIVIPCAACGVSTCYYAARLFAEGWPAVTIVQYNLISIAAGMMAGLIGIGGGLIFAPFFLLMQVDPSVAVATSSTCVVFTSASTSLQYLFLGRVILSLGLVYGVVTLVASYVGTKSVHFLQDNWNARKSYISAIVGVGVSISALLSLYNMTLDFFELS